MSRIVCFSSQFQRRESVWGQYEVKTEADIWLKLFIS